MRDILWRTEDTRGGYQERILGSLDELSVIEAVSHDGKPSAIWLAFDYWKSLCHGGKLPKNAAFDALRLAPLNARAGSATSYVDVRASDPMHYIFHSHPGHFHGASSPYPRHEGLPIGFHPLKWNRGALAEEYWLCVSTRTPLYHEISQTYCGLSRVYRRVLLPVVDDQERIVRLYTAIRLNDSCPPLAA